MYHSIDEVIYSDWPEQLTSAMETWNIDVSTSSCPYMNSPIIEQKNCLEDRRSSNWFIANSLLCFASKNCIINKNKQNVISIKANQNNYNYSNIFDHLKTNFSLCMSHVSKKTLQSKSVLWHLSTNQPISLPKLFV